MAQRLSEGLLKYSERRALSGAASEETRSVLAWQMVSSLRRLDYTRLRMGRSIDPARADPNDSMFDPELAAVLHARAGRMEEAMWLVFLATHFGNSGVTGWRLLKAVYSGLGKGAWTWDRVNADPDAFASWLESNRHELTGRFSNHRKYESLKPGPKGTAAVVRSYLTWVGKDGTHAALVSRLVREGGNDPHSIFDRFYRDMIVHRFGRLAKFDYLTLLGRLHLAPIDPGLAYIREASGPRAGSRLLFLGDEEDGSHDAELDAWVVELGAQLGLGMQVMEDSICNWQKSPTRFVHFRG